MTISASNLQFVAASRMNDDLNPSFAAGGSGGAPSTSIVQTGVENNVFPDVMPADRISGRRQLRLVYPSVLSNDNDMLSSARAMVLDRPTDPNVELFAFLASSVGGPVNQQTLAYYAAYALGVYGIALDTPSPTGTIDGTDLNKVNSISSTTGAVLETDLRVGDKVLVSAGSKTAYWRTLTAVNLAGNTATFSGTSPFAAADAVTIRKYTVPTFSISSPALLTVALSAGGQDITVDKLDVRVYPAGATGSTPGIVNTVTLGGERAPMFVPGGLVLLQHASTSAREVRVVERVNYATGVVRISAGATNAYPIGSKITTLLPMGDLQASVSLPPFSQQAWTRTWADAVSGLSVSPLYNGTISLINEGAITDRWAIVFTSTTAFYLLSERFGQIASGSTTTAFAPLNPMTSQPFFTLAAAGWNAGRLPGNVLRFNTQAAQSAVWAARVISPSAAAGTVNGSLAIYGDVNA